MHINKHYQLESVKIKDLLRKNIEELTHTHLQGMNLSPLVIYLLRYH